MGLRFQKSNFGYSLVEVLAAMTLMGILAYFISQPIFRMQLASLEQTNRASAYSQLDQLVLNIKKDIQRRALSVEGVEPVASVFGETGDEEECYDLLVRQTIVSPASVQRIEYKTECNGIDMPAGVLPALLHPQLRTPCLKAPTLTRTVWKDETVVGDKTSLTYPLGELKAAAICFRPDMIPPGVITVDASVAYASSNKDWKVAKRTFVLKVNEAGANVEILPPQ